MCQSLLAHDIDPPPTQDDPPPTQDDSPPDQVDSKPQSFPVKSDDDGYLYLSRAGRMSGYNRFSKLPVVCYEVCRASVSAATVSCVTHLRRVGKGVPQR